MISVVFPRVERHDMRFFICCEDGGWRGSGGERCGGEMAALAAIGVVIRALMSATNMVTKTAEDIL